MEAHRYGLSAAALKYLAALFMLVLSLIHI